jgi:hypothetical protein
MEAHGKLPLLFQCLSCNLELRKDLFQIGGLQLLVSCKEMRRIFTGPLFCLRLRRCNRVSDLQSRLLVLLHSPQLRVDFFAHAVCSGSSVLRHVDCIPSDVERQRLVLHFNLSEIHRAVDLIQAVDMSRLQGLKEVIVDGWECLPFNEICSIVACDPPIQNVMIANRAFRVRDRHFEDFALVGF